MKYFIDHLCIPAGFKNVTNITPEPESMDYQGFRLNINEIKIIFRQAKITPKKEGLFVTLWQRKSPKLPIEPFSEHEADFSIIYVSNGTHQGYFIFNSSILVAKNIFSKNENSGKLGFRVYPPWSSPSSTQGITTQKWQTNYFVYLEQNIEKFKSLFEK